MNRITLPTPEQTPAATLPLLDAVKKQLGVVPNLMKLVGNSPAALEGYLSLNGALNKGALDAKTRERIALAIAEFNGCSYCLSAHTYLGKNVAKLDDAEIAANRNGESSDPKAAAAVLFATRVAIERGHVSERLEPVVGDAVATIQADFFQWQAGKPRQARVGDGRLVDRQASER